MARFGVTNLTLTTPGVLLYNWKEVLKLAGGVVQSSSDGTTYNASGDQITSGASGAGGFNNNGAWCVIKFGDRYYCAQTNGSGVLSATNVRMLYSLNAFSGGTPTATRVPTSVNQQFLLGGGTDVSPTYSAPGGFAGTSRAQIVAEDSAISGVRPWLWAITSTPGSTAAGFLGCEPMMPGSYLADNDPCVHGYTTGATIAFSGWLGYGTGSATWVSGALTANSAPYDGTVGPDVTSGNDANGFAEISGNVAAIKRVKGIMAKAIAFKGPSRVYPATANRTTDAYLYWSNYALMYINNTEPSVA